jgi:hypothetical protein
MGDRDPAETATHQHEREEDLGNAHHNHEEEEKEEGGEKQEEKVRT